MYQQINLYQPIFRKQRQIFSAMTMVQAAGIVAVALLGFYFFGLWRVTALEAEATRLEGTEAGLLTRLASIDPSLSMNRTAEVEEEIRRLNATLRDQTLLVDALREQSLGTTEGFSGFLAALGRQHTPELWLTQFAINGSTRALELSGRSTRVELVPQYLEALGREPALAGQRFDRLEIARDETSAEVTFEATSKAAEATKERETLARQAQ